MNGYCMYLIKQPNKGTVVTANPCNNNYYKDLAEAIYINIQSKTNYKPYICNQKWLVLGELSSYTNSLICCLRKDCGEDALLYVRIQNSKT